MREHPIDDSAARNRPGATLNVPGPSFAITRRNRDGTIDELVDGEWVTVDKAEK